MNRIKDMIDRYVTKLENNNVSLAQMALWVITIGIVKYIFEDIIFFRQMNAVDKMADCIYIVLFYVMVFLYSAVLIKVFSNQPMKKVLNCFLFFFPLLLLPPIVDYYFTGIEKYYLVSFGTPLWETLIHNPGITITGLYMMFLGGCYVTLRNGIKSGVFCGLGLYLIYYYVFASELQENIRDAILSYGFPEVFPERFLSAPGVYTYNIIFCFATLLLSVLFIYCLDEEHKVYKKLFQRIRLERGLQYIMILFFSFTVVGDYHPQRIFIFIVNCLGVLLIWVGSVMINDFYDQASDSINGQQRNMTMLLTREEAYGFAIWLWALAALLGLQISQEVFQIYLVIITISYLYSAPPIRLKRFMFSSIFIGICTFWLVLITVFSNINYFYYDNKILGIAILFGLTMALGSNVIDLKDYKGDQMTGVRSLPVVYGFKNAKVIIAVLTGLSYLVIGYILAKYMKTSLYYAALLPAVAMPIMILFYKNTKKWWSVYFLFHIITLFNGGLINIFFAKFHLIFTF